MTNVRAWSLAQVLMASGVWCALVLVLIVVWIYAQLHPFSGGSGGGAVVVNPFWIAVMVCGPPMVLTVVWFVLRVRSS